MQQVTLDFGRGDCSSVDHLVARLRNAGMRQIRAARSALIQEHAAFGRDVSEIMSAQTSNQAAAVVTVEAVPLQHRLHAGEGFQRRFRLVNRMIRAKRP